MTAQFWLERMFHDLAVSQRAVDGSKVIGVVVGMSPFYSGFDRGIIV